MYCIGTRYSSDQLVKIPGRSGLVVRGYCAVCTKTTCPKGGDSIDEGLTYYFRFHISDRAVAPPPNRPEKGLVTIMLRDGKRYRIEECIELTGVYCTLYSIHICS